MTDNGDSAYKVYLEYLEKEMTIMGVLSVFVALAVAGILDKTIGAPSGTSFGADLWNNQPTLISLGSASLLMAALLFYRQRSDLAFWYGQIAISLTAGKYDEPTTAQLIHDVDVWSAWRKYYWAFAFLTLAFCLFAMALIAHLNDLTETAISLATLAAVVFVMSVWVRHQLVFETFDHEYAPRIRWRQSTRVERKQLRRNRPTYWWRSASIRKPDETYPIGDSSSP